MRCTRGYKETLRSVQWLSQKVKYTKVLKNAFIIIFVVVIVLLEVNADSDDLVEVTARLTAWSSCVLLFFSNIDPWTFEGFLLLLYLISQSIPDRSIKVKIVYAIFILLLTWDKVSALPFSKWPFSSIMMKKYRMEKKMRKGIWIFIIRNLACNGIAVKMCSLKP